MSHAEKDEDLLGAPLAMEVMDLTSDRGSTRLGADLLMGPADSDGLSNLLGDSKLEDQYVQDQIRNLDQLFDAQGLHELKSSGPDDGQERQRNMLMSKVYELEDQVISKDDKCKEQAKINAELADKIQQLEFDKDMLFKEAENLKKREYDFGGLLDSGELEAQIQFKDQELIDYK